MDWIESTTSQQDVSYDSDGHLSLSRTFKVWDVSTTAFWQSPTSITNASGQSLPPIGSSLGTVSGPSPVIPDGAHVQLRLYKYSLQPVSAVLFIVIAHYSNDQRLIPLGQQYRGNQQYSLVNIPFVQTIPVIRAGQTPQASGTLPVAWRETSIALPLYKHRISQTVSVLRKARASAEQSSLGQVGRLHNLPQWGWARYEGMDISLRSPQAMDVTYHWDWEAGIGMLWLYRGVRTDPPDTPIKSIYPNGTTPLMPELGGDTWLLPPYHTIEMIMQQVGNARRPVWYWRTQTDIALNGFLALYGYSNFEWNVT